MRPAIVMAWRDMGDPHRLAAYEFCRAYWEEWMDGIPIVIGDAEPFSRAAGINAGVRKAIEDHAATVIFQPDPDSLIPAGRAQLAIDLASGEPGTVHPYDEYLYLKEAPTARILDGVHHWAEYGGNDIACWAHGPNGTGLVSCYSVETWEQAGGFDERFGVWAGDDAAFALAAGVLVAPGRRIPDPAWHLWHPQHPDSIPGTSGYRAQWSILAEYLKAETSEQMKAVIAGRGQQ